MAQGKTFTVKKKAFLNWYYNSGADQDQEQMRTDLGDSIIEQLIEYGKVTTTAEEIFDECEISCMPCYLLEEFDNDYDDCVEIMDEDSIDLSVDEVKLID